MMNFVQFLSNGSLLSLHDSGMPFTSTNGHKDHTVIFEKLDRATTNFLLINLFPDFKVHNFPIYGSDQSCEIHPVPK